MPAACVLTAASSERREMPRARSDDKALSQLQCCSSDLVSLWACLASTWDPTPLPGGGFVSPYCGSYHPSGPGCTSTRTYASTATDSNGGVSTVRRHHPPATLKCGSNCRGFRGSAGVRG